MSLQYWVKYALLSFCNKGRVIHNRSQGFFRKRKCDRCLIDGAWQGEKECNAFFYLPKMEVHHWVICTTWLQHSRYQFLSHIYDATLQGQHNKHFLLCLCTPFLKEVKCQIFRESTYNSINITRTLQQCTSPFGTSALVTRWLWSNFIAQIIK